MNRSNGRGNGSSNTGWRIVSMKTAAVVITLFLVASAIGWICSELFPRDIDSREEVYRERWGDTRYGVITFLQLHSPFNSFWYRSVLALFFLVLLGCVTTGWNRRIRRSFSVPEPEDISEPPSGKGSIVISWGDLALSRVEKDDITGRYARELGSPMDVDDDFLSRLFDKAAGIFRRKRYALKTKRSGDGILFTLQGGRFHYPGSLIFHLGILIITVGGMIGSFMGRSELVYGKKGDSLNLFGGPDSIRVEEFRILRNEEGAVTEYLTFITVPGEGTEGSGRKMVEVNHPVGYRGYDIYQSSYYVAEDELSWARITCRRGDRTETFNAAPGEEVELAEWGWTVEVVDYIPDFRMGPDGAYSAGRRMRNPAVEIEATGDFGKERGWIFPRSNSMHSTLDIPARFEIIYLEPVFYTGLEITRSPHAPVIVAGIAAAVLGLILMFGSQYRVLRGKADKAGMIITGRYLRTGSAGLRREIEGELTDMLVAYREGGIHGNSR